MKILINYADDNFKNQQKRNSRTGIKYGKFEKVIEYSPEELEADFYEKTASFINNNKRGGGYWIWKPYIILKTLLERSSQGDYIFYCDSGAMFVNSIDFLIRDLERTNQKIFLTEIPLLEYQWTKFECFKTLECLDEKYYYSNQVQSGFILIKNCQESIAFFKEYLNICLNYKMINDEKDEKINNDLIDHRHDQSIISLLAKKNNLQFFRDISQYGVRPWQYIRPERNYCIKKYSNSSYPQIVSLYRKENWMKILFKEKVKDFLSIKLRY